MMPFLLGLKNQLLGTKKDENVNKNRNLTYIKHKITDNNAKSQEIFYYLSTDTTICLSDYKCIKINRALFYANAKSDAIFHMLFGPLKDNMTIIQDIDSATFKLFLDCIMDFEPYTYDNAFQIFPVVWKYQIEEPITKCINALEPTEMSEKVCHVLNLATFYACDSLLVKVLVFILNNYNPYKFIEDKNYLFLLEPEPLSEILNRITLDSHLLILIMDWGNDYLRRNDNYKSIRDLFEHENILKFFKLRYFETTNALIEFSMSDLGQEIFPLNQIMPFLRNPDNLDHRISHWKMVCKGDSFTDEIVIRETETNEKDTILYTYEIEMNPFVLHNIIPMNETVEIIKREVAVSKEVNGYQKKISRSSCCMTVKRETLVQKSCYENFLVKITVEKNPRGRSEIHGDTITLQIKWNFMCDCRIFLSNRPKDKLNNSKNLYFLKNIICTGVVRLRNNNPFQNHHY